MLVASSDQLHVALFPTEAVYVRFARGLRLRPVAKGILGFSMLPGEPPWRGAIQGLREAIPSLGPRRAKVRVVLSNEFVRYAVMQGLPGSGVLNGREGHLRALFREIHGPAADTWHVCESPYVEGIRPLGCAIDRELLAELKSIFDRKPLRLASVQPLLVAGFSEFRNTLGTSGCFLLHEPGGLCGGTYAEGEWKTLEATRLAHGLSVAEAVDRKIQAGEIAPGTPIYVLSSRANSAQTGELESRHPLMVLQPPQRAGAAYAMALIGNSR